MLIRKPRPDDLDALVALQAAYEKEEVSVGSEPHPADLIAQGRGISLFVKKSNPAARNVYRNIGFEILDGYRIDYF